MSGARRCRTGLLAFLLAAGLPAGAGTAGATAPAHPERDAPAQQVVASDLDVPWGITFTPFGDALVVERGTRSILSVRDGVVRPVQQVDDASTADEAGLLGIAVSPNYLVDHEVYVYYSTDTDNRVARFRLGEQPQPIRTGIPRNAHHDGGALTFGPDGMLYAGTGDVTTPRVAQDPRSPAGKILRMTPDGAPAPGNPFPDSVVYALGFRNVEGLTFGPDGQLYASDIGQDKWDEIDAVHSGGNYGWPTCEGPCHRAGYVDPMVAWHPADATPGGLAYWHGALYSAAIRGGRLWQVPLGGPDRSPRAVSLGDRGRLRTVVPAPDGSLWVTTTNRDDKRGTVHPDDDLILSVRP